MAKQSKHVAPYPPEFRAEAIRLARTQRQAARTDCAENLA